MTFFALVGAWGAGRLLGDGATASGLAVLQTAPPSATSAAPRPDTPAPRAPGPSDEPPPAPSAAPADSPSAATAPAQPAPVSATPPPAQTAVSAADEIAQQQALEKLGKAYLLAIQVNDPVALRGMLASRCLGADVPALLARRATEISVAAGVAIEEITPLNQYVGHIDVAAGEAHTVLQFIARGEHSQLYTADGWLLENGAWKSANC